MNAALIVVLVAHGLLLGWAASEPTPVDRRLLWALAVTAVLTAALALLADLPVVACIASGAAGAYLAFISPTGAER